MIPSPSLSILFASARVAARTFAILKGFAQACRPVPSTLQTQRVDVVLPGRRAITVICTAFPSVRAHGRCLRVEGHSTRDGSANGQILFAGFANGHG